MKGDSNNITRWGMSALAFFLAGGIFFTGYQIGSGSTAIVTPVDTYGEPIVSSSEFSPFWKAWHILEEKFVGATSTDTTTNEAKVWGAIAGLAESYGDPYTVFFPPKEKEIFETSISGNFEGVGMEVGMQDNYLTVIAPLKGTPAEKAGVLPGDKIIKIGDELTQGLSVDEAVDKIRGKKGTTVTLTLAREGVNEPLEISIVRDTINIPSLDYELREDGVFVISLYNFSAPSVSEFKKAIREFQESGNKDLIIDVRGNPGGYLDAAVEIASYFLPAGKIIVTEDYGKNGESRVHRSKGYDLLKDDIDIVILVNKGSASASEILAGALREHNKATLVGEQTFGKGSVQEVVDITKDTSLKVTVARWLTPLGTSISHGGITPDIEVVLTAEDIQAEHDVQMEKALEVVKN